MKRLLKAAALLVCLGMSTGALAQEELTLHVAAGALDRQTAQRALDQLSGALSKADWTLAMEEETGESLRDLVLSGREPALAICAPGEAAPFAEEGLLHLLQKRVGSMARVQRQVLDPCTQDEELFMAPLRATHRQMAVNARAFERRRLSYLLDERAHPVWYPTQLYQILEEFLIADEIALEIWPAEPDSSAAIEALAQAIYGGSLLCEDGERVTAATAEMIAGVGWLCESLRTGMIAACESREEALARFIAGETAMFLDWTAQDAQRYAKELEERGMRVVTVDYPSSVSLPVRAFEAVGVCAFKSGAPERDALALAAASILSDDAQGLFAPRAIWRDDAIWLADLSAGSRGQTLRRLFCQALADVIAGETDAQTAMGRVQAIMDALP